MQTNRLAALLFTIAAFPAHAGSVTVTYPDPDKFTDAGDRNTDPRKIMEVLERHLHELGDKLLPAGTRVEIEVLDLDRAGRPRGNLPTEIRIMTGKGDLPCIDLRYSVETSGRPTEAVRERVCDSDYLRPLEFRYDEHDPVVYEKRMLDQWFARRFAKGEPPR
jgi:hypothetical protein